MSQDYNWIDDSGHSRRSTVVFTAVDVTDEILGLARSLEDEWFSRAVWIDWSSFFSDLNCVVIPSSGRELDLGTEPGSPGMDRIQRHIRSRRIASIARWKLAADRTTRIDPVVQAKPDSKLEPAVHGTWANPATREAASPTVRFAGSRSTRQLLITRISADNRYEHRDRVDRRQDQDSDAQRDFRASRSARRTGGSRDATKFREKARPNGYTVSRRGFISADIRAAYEAAN